MARPEDEIEDDWYRTYWGTGDLEPEVDEDDEDDVFCRVDFHDARSQELYDGMHEADRVGVALSQPSCHFARIFALLRPDERQRLLDDAFKTHREIHPTIERKWDFVVATLYPANDELEEDELEEDELEEDELDSRAQERIRRILNGCDYNGLAQLLADTTLSHANDSEITRAGVERLFSTALGKHVLTADQAAALASCVRQNESRIEAFERDSEVILADSHIFGRDDLDIQRAKRVLERNLPTYFDKCGGVLQQQLSIVNPATLCGAFDLQETESGLFLPVRSRIEIATSLRDAFVAAERDRAALMNMSPRRFEEFMADIFSTLGFEVELTIASRDGGADLLCLKTLHGIPFRLAVEVKRYKENRRIDVSLVRAFVGANKKFRANRLLYVTTSDYTQPAIDFATSYAGHMLSLKGYDQIQEWCRECLNTQKPRILGPSANLLA